MQDVIVLNLSAVQLCVDIAAHTIASSNRATPNTMGEVFLQLAQMGVIDSNLADQPKKSVGFRNVAVHNYHDLNWDIVFVVASRNLEYLKNLPENISVSIDS